MRHTEFISTRSAQRGRHLVLVNDTRMEPVVDPLPTVTPPDMTTVRQLTHAMMNRLWIPHTTSIVGLLGVGLYTTA